MSQISLSSLTPTGQPGSVSRGSSPLPNVGGLSVERQLTPIAPAAIGVAPEAVAANAIANALQGASSIIGTLGALAERDKELSDQVERGQAAEQAKLDALRFAERLEKGEIPIAANTSPLDTAMAFVNSQVAGQSENYQSEYRKILPSLFQGVARKRADAESNLRQEVFRYASIEASSATTTEQVNAIISRVSERLGPGVPLTDVRDAIIGPALTAAALSGSSGEAAFRALSSIEGIAPDAIARADRMRSERLSAETSARNAELAQKFAGLGPEALRVEAQAAFGDPANEASRPYLWSVIQGAQAELQQAENRAERERNQQESERTQSILLEGDRVNPDGSNPAGEIAYYGNVLIFQDLTPSQSRAVYAQLGRAASALQSNQENESRVLQQQAVEQARGNEIASEVKRAQSGIVTALAPSTTNVNGQDVNISGEAKRQAYVDEIDRELAQGVASGQFRTTEQKVQHLATRLASAPSVRHPQLTALLDGGLQAITPETKEGDPSVAQAVESYKAYVALKAYPEVLASHTNAQTLVTMRAVDGALTTQFSDPARAILEVRRAEAAMQRTGSPLVTEEDVRKRNTRMHPNTVGRVVIAANLTTGTHHNRMIAAEQYVTGNTVEVRAGDTQVPISTFQYPWLKDAAQNKGATFQDLSDALVAAVRSSAGELASVFPNDLALLPTQSGGWMVQRSGSMIVSGADPDLIPYTPPIADEDAQLLHQYMAQEEGRRSLGDLSARKVFNQLFSTLGPQNAESAARVENFMRMGATAAPLAIPAAIGLATEVLSGDFSRRPPSETPSNRGTTVPRRAEFIMSSADEARLAPFLDAITRHVYRSRETSFDRAATTGLMTR